MTQRNEAYKKKENLKRLIKDKPWLKGMFEKDLQKAENEYLKAEISEMKEKELRRNNGFNW